MGKIALKGEDISSWSIRKRGGNHILRDAKSKSYDYTAYCF